MAFNIEEFKSNLDTFGGVLRNNKFKVFIPAPTGLAGPNGSVNDLRDMMFLAESVSLPGVSLSTHDVRRYGYGPIEKRPISHTFTDLNIGFMGTADGAAFKIMHSWISLISNFDMREGINSPTYPYLMNYKNTYVTDIHILVYSDKAQSEPVLDIAVREAYPIQIMETPLAWSTQNDYIKFNVQFAYVDWYFEQTAQE